MQNPFRFLKHIAFAEAISFLVLLGIAMPLKYVWHLPIAVRIVGLLHGILFIVLCFALVRAIRVGKWSIGNAMVVFIAAFLPFGPFFLHRRLDESACEFSSR
jgi:integral membrane protein